MKKYEEKSKYHTKQTLKIGKNMEVSFPTVCVYWQPTDNVIINKTNNKQTNK